MKMPKGLTSTNTVMSLFARHLQKRSEKTLIGTPVLYELADKHPLPMNSGTTIFIPRHIAKNRIRALTEQTIIGTCATSAHYYTGTVVPYGDANSYSDFLVDVHEIPTMISDDVNAMTRYAANKVDSLIGAQLSNAGTFVNPDGAQGVGTILSTTPMKQRYLFDATAVLAGNDAPTYGDGNYATVVHPRQQHDLFVNTSAANQMGSVKGGSENFLQMTEMGQRKLANATIGILGQQRVITSTVAARYLYAATSDTASAGAAGMESANSGYMAVSMGPGAVAAVDLGTSRFKTYIKGFDSGGTLDPIEQQMTAGIKFRFVAVAMDTANRLVRTASGKTL